MFAYQGRGLWKSILSFHYVDPRGGGSSSGCHGNSHGQSSNHTFSVDGIKWGGTVKLQKTLTSVSANGLNWYLRTLYQQDAHTVFPYFPHIHTAPSSIAYSSQCDWMGSKDRCSHQKNEARNQQRPQMRSLDTHSDSTGITKRSTSPQQESCYHWWSLTQRFTTEDERLSPKRGILLITPFHSRLRGLWERGEAWEDSESRRWWMVLRKMILRAFSRHNSAEA